jgi:hypothetical protein
MTILAVIARQSGAVVLPNEGKGWINRLQIRSATSKRLYTVAQRESDGVWGCSCPGWVTKRNCKHLKAMMPALNTLDAPKNSVKGIR